MSRSSIRAAIASGLLSCAVAVPLLTAPGASAVAGGSPAGVGVDGYSARLSIGTGDKQRICSGTLVDVTLVLTAKSCFDRGAGVAAGAPSAENATTITVGKADLASPGGYVSDVVKLIPHADRDLVLAKLARPAFQVIPATIAGTAPTAGETLRVAGYGRTEDAWFPGTLHNAAVTVKSISGAEVGIESATAGASAVCKGDAGGPTLRGTGAAAELVAVNSRSWQGGCLGTSSGRTDAVSTRVDGLAGWVKGAVEPLDLGWDICDTFPQGGRSLCGPILAKYMTLGGPAGTLGAPLTDTTVIGIGRYAHFAGSPATGGAASVYWSPTTGAHSLYGPARTKWSQLGWENSWLGYPTADTQVTLTGTRTDFRNGFATTVNSNANLAGLHTYNVGEVAVTAGDFTSDGRDDAITIDADGYLWLHPGQANGTLGQPVALWQDGAWKGITKLAAGDFTGDGKTDLVAIWTDGQLELYPGNGNATFQASAPLWADSGSPKLYKDAKEIFAGDFTGDGKADLGVVWASGSLWLAPGNNTGRLNNNGLAPIHMWPEEIWAGARNVLAGDFTGDGKTDMGVIWGGGSFYMQPGDGQGHIQGGLNMWPDNTWSGARDVAGGDFAGDGQDDVLSIWPDGTLHLYPNLKPL
ncbi:FG-GAP-like repeat-containing protein [Streptomyces sp. AB3(2024)]|uniref:FG-GAP-like repeat-containing protein n=1 Tax=Streptomyces sp. AB3(2024) TaxID=3317321 RepID=UPI0035A2A15A